MTTSSPQTPGDSPYPHDPSRGGAADGLPRYSPGPHGAGHGLPQQPGPAPAPPLLGRLLTLTLASAGLYTLYAITSLVLTSTMDLAEAYERMGMPAEQADRAGAMAGRFGELTVLAGLVVMAVVLGLYALVYVFLKKGQNWARVLGIVLAILSALSVLTGFLSAWIFGGWGFVLIAVGIAFIVVNVLWLVTAFKAPVAGWFHQQRHAG